MHTFLRQKIYNYKIYFIFYLFYNLNNRKKIIKKKISKILNTKLFLFINMARIGLFLIVKSIVKDKKKIIIMSPFTIFDLVNKILAAGGIPKFVDTQPNSPHINLREIRKNYNKNVIAILITHYHSNNKEIKKIRNFCNKKKIFLIEDCAIAFGSKYYGKNIGFYGDFSIFSFGIFKFISNPLGGLIRFRKKKYFNIVKKKIYSENLTNSIYLKFYLKGLIYKFFLNFFPFNFIIKKIIKIGTKLNVTFIKNLINNDPNPIIDLKINKNILCKPNKYQILSIIDQIKYIKNDRIVRSKNAMIYSQYIKKNKMLIKPDLDFLNDPIVNYPILTKNKEKLYKFLINNNFDVANHYYRNLNEIKTFKKFGKKLINIKKYSNNLICLPVYPGLSIQYLINMSNKINEFTSKNNS